MSSAACVRTASLRRRRMRFLVTALPAFFVTVTPKRGGSSSLRRRTSSRNRGPRRFSPARAARNSARLRSLPVGLGVNGSAPGMPVRRKAACDRGNGGRRRRRGRPWWPCGRGTRGAAYGQAWKAGRYASFIYYRGVRPFLIPSRLRSGALRAGSEHSKAAPGRAARAWRPYMDGVAASQSAPRLRRVGSRGWARPRCAAAATPGRARQ